MNWTLGAMRDHNVADPIGGLGPRVERAPTPAPAPVVRPDGIVVHPDGKLSTELPLPEGHPDATPPAAPEPEPGAHGFLRIRFLGGHCIPNCHIGHEFDARRRTDFRGWEFDGIGRWQGCVWFIADSTEGKSWERA